MDIPDIQTESLTPTHWLVIVLCIISGIVHLSLGIKFFPGAQPVAFLLAGLGFFGAIILFLLDYRRQLLYRIGIPFVGLQIVLYLLINYREAPAISPVEAIDKTAQIIIIILLVYLIRSEE